MKARKNILTPFGMALLFLSLVYIGAEAVFNMRLLEVAGTARSAPDAIDDLQYFGRSVSACGFTLLVLGVFELQGFVLSTRRQWGLALALAVLCLMPFFALFWQNLSPLFYAAGQAYETHLEPFEMTLAFVPILGAAALIASGGYRQALLVAALVLMAWPAMFLSQKILIEGALIDRTTWQERQDARSMLMLRSALEDGVIQLGDLQLHDDAKGEADMKAVRIVMSALWMMNPASVLQDLKNNRDRLVEYAAANGTWFSTSDAYGKYVRKVKHERSDYIDKMMEKYYVPYKQASDMYENAMNDAFLDAEAAKANAQVQQGIDDGWARYQAGVSDMRQSVSVAVGSALRGAAPALRYLDGYCRTHECQTVDPAQQVQDLQDAAEDKFYVKTGYHSNIETKAEFARQKRTQDDIRAQVQSRLRARFGLPSFTLPAQWTYDPVSFSKTIKTMMRTQAKDAWRKKFGDTLPQGLSPDAFVAKIGVHIPSESELIMSPDDFFRTYVLPGNQKMVDDMLAQMNAARAKYPPDATAPAEGKEYASALYIPTISLVVSLSVVMLTLLRGLLAGAGIAFEMAAQKWGAKKPSTGRTYAVQGAVLAAFVLFMLALPHLVPNPYAAGQTYRRYLVDAQNHHPVVARVLNWAVGVQPVIYRLGTDLRHMTGGG